MKSRNFKILAMIIIAGFIFTNKARAFDLTDHETITREAVKELNACFPNTLSSTETDDLVHANRKEDWAFWTKWTLYSHYYNPTKNLKMKWRYTSPTRVQRLESDINQKLCDANHREDLISNLGHAIHQIQDMAVPLHVVPIVHGLGESFESYRYTGALPSGISCANLGQNNEIQNDHNLMDLLNETALTTLKTITESKFTVLKNGAPYTTTWESFWKQSNDDSFGSRGEFGNNYGRMSFNEAGNQYQISSDLYWNFKAQQLRAAVAATKKALYDILIARASKCESSNATIAEFARTPSTR